MAASLWLASVLLLPPGGTSPWDIDPKPTVEAASKRNDAGDDPVKRAALARWCVERGLYGDAVNALERISPLPEDATKLLGLTDANDPRSYEESARFAEAATWKPATLNVLTDKQRQEIVRSRMRPIREAIQSTYFDLWSDLPDPELKPYSLELNGFYRAFKNRFSAYEPRNVDVLLFRNRSDFLQNYASMSGFTGEHVLGYYRPDLQRLVFFHDPRNQSEIFETARHECTHLLIDQCFHKAPLPKWFHEGMACYFGVGGLDAKGDYAAGLVATLMRKLRGKKKLDLGVLFTLDPGKFVYDHYALSWSVIHFANAGRYQASFPQFLKALRERTEEELTSETAAKLCADVFRDTITTDDDGFEAAWHEYFTTAFRFDRPDQLVDLGTNCVETASWVESPAEREELLEIGRRAVAAVPQPLDAELLARRNIASARFAALHAREHADSMRSLRIALRTVLDRLRAIPTLIDESKRAAIVREALRVPRGIVRATVPRGQTFDVRAALLPSAAPDARESAESKSVIVLVDELEEHAYAALARALNADPLDVDAAEQWLWLSIESAPARIPEIVPTLLLLNAADPSDRHRGMLGVAYMSLGKHALGKRWVDDGRWVSAGPNQMQPYLDFAGLTYDDAK